MTMRVRPEPYLWDGFDVGENGARHWGMKDFCALLGLRPATKYETTWERIAKAVRDHVPVANRPTIFRHMAPCCC